MYTDPTTEVENEVQAFRRRPLLVGVILLAIVAYGVWYMTGGSPTGSVRQAEAAVRADPFPGNATHPTVISVQCTQNGQPFFARLANLLHTNSTGNHSNNNGPSTTYTCTGTTTAGQPAYWCVSFAPRNSSYTGPPTVAARFANESCS